MNTRSNLFLSFIGVIVFLAFSGQAAADIWIFPDNNPSNPNNVYVNPITGETSILGNYRDFSIFGQNTLDVAGYLNAVAMPVAPHVEYTPANNTQPGWVNPGYDWSSGQHTYVINLLSPTGGRPAAVPGLHPWNGLQGPVAMIGGVSGLLILYNSPITLPNTAEGFLDPAFLDKVTAIVAFVPGCSTAFVYEKVSVSEPGTLLLLGGGLIALGVIRRKFKS